MPATDIGTARRARIPDVELTERSHLRLLQSIQWGSHVIQPGTWCRIGQSDRLRLLEGRHVFFTTKRDAQRWLKDGVLELVEAPPAASPAPQVLASGAPRSAPTVKGLDWNDLPGTLGEASAGDTAAATRSISDVKLLGDIHSVESTGKARTTVLRAVVRRLRNLPDGSDLADRLDGSAA